MQEKIFVGWMASWEKIFEFLYQNDASKTGRVIENAKTIIE